MRLRRLIRENRATLVCGALVVAALLMGFLARRLLAGGGTGDLVALVHDADGRTHELPLDRDDELTVRTSLGTNTIVVEDGAVRMAAADCPNGTCLLTEPLRTPGAQIICLPHQLWIEVCEAGEAGGNLDVSLAEPPEPGVDLQAR